MRRMHASPPARLDPEAAVGRGGWPLGGGGAGRAAPRRRGVRRGATTACRRWGTRRRGWGSTTPACGTRAATRRGAPAPPVARRARGTPAPSACGWATPGWPVSARGPRRGPTTASAVRTRGSRPTAPARPRRRGRARALGHRRPRRWPRPPPADGAGSPAARRCPGGLGPGIQLVARAATAGEHPRGHPAGGRVDAPPCRRRGPQAPLGPWALAGPG